MAQSTKQRSMADKWRGIVRLTRWTEYLTFVIPATVFGALLTQAAPDWRLISVTAANVLAVAYAFMINDIEDAPDDAVEEARSARNPVSSGEITAREGWIASLVVAVLSAVLFAAGGRWVFGIGITTLLLSHFYSWKPVRLKAWPVADVVSHSLMLSGLLFLAGYFIYDQSPGWVWLVAIAVTLISVYGQLYNQIRDYDMDKAAGLHNTAIVVGERVTRVLAYSCIGLAVVFFLSGFFVGVIPLWIPVVGAAIWAAITVIYKPKQDMRGGESEGADARIQIPFIITANLTVAIGLVMALVA